MNVNAWNAYNYRMQIPPTDIITATSYMFKTAILKQTYTLSVQHSTLHGPATWSPLMKKLPEYPEEPQHTVRVGSTSDLQLLPYQKDDTGFLAFCCLGFLKFRLCWSYLLRCPWSFLLILPPLAPGAESEAKLIKSVLSVLSSSSTKESQ